VPGHSAADRSLAVRPKRPDDFLVHSFAGDDPADCLIYVRRRLGVTRDRRDWPQPAKHWHAIWHEAAHPRGTLVEKYLASRSLQLPAEAANEALRFHPCCPFGRTTTPAMVALVRDIRSNEPIGIHRTALDSSGRKRALDAFGKGKCADRLALGQIKGGAVKLTPDEDVTTGLAIGEGIETALSLTCLPDWGGPVWACLCADNLAAYPVLGGIDALVVAADHDDAGRNAVRQVIRRWHEAGRETLVIEPDEHGTDLNDILHSKG